MNRQLTIVIFATAATSFFCHGVWVNQGSERHVHVDTVDASVSVTADWDEKIPVAGLEEPLNPEVAVAQANKHNSKGNDSIAIDSLHDSKIAADDRYSEQPGDYVKRFQLRRLTGKIPKE